MEVLELPRPVINFMRSISKEMHRYTLSWDMFGASDSVSLTLTWKLNCDVTDEDHGRRSRRQHQQKINDLIQSTQTSSSDTSEQFSKKYNCGHSGSQQRSKKTPKLNKKQMQHFKLDNLAGELMNKKLDGSLSRKSSPSPTNQSYHSTRSSRQNLDSSFSRRNLSAESLHNKRLEKESERNGYQSSRSKHKPYKSHSLNRGKSLENCDQLNDSNNHHSESNCPCCEKYNNNNKNLNDINEVLKFSSLRLQRRNRSSSRKNNDYYLSESAQQPCQPRVQFDISNLQKNSKPDKSTSKLKDQNTVPISCLKNGDNHMVTQSKPNKDLLNYAYSLSDSTTLSEDEEDNTVKSNQGPFDETENNPWIKRMNSNPTNLENNEDSIETKFLNTETAKMHNQRHSAKLNYYDFNDPENNLSDSDYFHNFKESYTNSLPFLSSSSNKYLNNSSQGGSNRVKFA